MVRGLITAVLIVLFIGLFIWAFSEKRKSAFDEASRLPFVGDDADPTIVQGDKS